MRPQEKEEKRSVDVIISLRKGKEGRRGERVVRIFREGRPYSSPGNRLLLEERGLDYYGVEFKLPFQANRAHERGGRKRSF